MKKIILFLSIIISVFACTDDDDVFDVTIPVSNITFEPIAAGAIIHYDIPDNSEIYGIRVSYKNEKGEQIVKEGSYLSTSIVLDGFIEKQTDVPVKIVLVNKQGVVSETTETSFSTLDCAGIQAFNSLEIKPEDIGFTVKCEVPANPRILMHISYIGISDFTKVEEVIRIKTINLSEGENIVNCNKIESIIPEDFIVIIRIEDFKGNIVKEEKFSDLNINWE